MIHGGTADIYVLTLADDAVKKIVSQPGRDTNPRWSPDGKQIVFSSAMGKELSTSQQISRLAVVAADGGTPRSITDAFDENPFVIAWKPDGLYFSALQKTAAPPLPVDPASRADHAGHGAGRADGRRLLASTATAGASRSRPVADAACRSLRLATMTSFAPQSPDRHDGAGGRSSLGTREVISWKSQDGATIEGVLIKPADFDPAKKYPLLVHHPRRSDRHRSAGRCSPDTRYYPARHLGRRAARWC